jgi:hypothetical protein
MRRHTESPVGRAVSVRPELCGPGRWFANRGSIDRCRPCRRIARGGRRTLPVDACRRSFLFSGRRTTQPCTGSRHFLVPALPIPTGLYFGPRPVPLPIEMIATETRTHRIRNGAMSTRRPNDTQRFRLESCAWTPPCRFLAPQSLGWLRLTICRHNDALRRHPLGGDGRTIETRTWWRCHRDSLGVHRGLVASIELNHAAAVEAPVPAPTTNCPSWSCGAISTMMVTWQGS